MKDNKYYPRYINEFGKLVTEKTDEEIRKAAELELVEIEKYPCGYTFVYKNKYLPRIKFRGGSSSSAILGDLIKVDFDHKKERFGESISTTPANRVYDTMYCIYVKPDNAFRESPCINPDTSGKLDHGAEIECFEDMPEHPAFKALVATYFESEKISKYLASNDEECIEKNKDLIKVFDPETKTCI